MSAEPTEQDIEKVAAGLARIQEAQAVLESQPYDGVQGLPPEWVPEPSLDRFRKVRETLFSWGYTSAQVCEWLDRYCRIGEADDDWFIPGRHPTGQEANSQLFEDSIGYLAHLRYASSLAPEKGLALLAGDDAVRGYTTKMAAAAGGQKRAEQFVPENEDILRVAQEIRAEPTKRVLNKTEVARKVVRRLFPRLSGEGAEKKAQSIRRRI